MHLRRSIAGTLAIVVLAACASVAVPPGGVSTAGRSPERVARILATLQRLGVPGDPQHLPPPGALLFTSPIVRVHVDANHNYEFPAKWATFTRDAGGVHVSLDGKRYTYPAGAAIVENAGTMGAFVNPGQARPGSLAHRTPDAVL